MHDLAQRAAASPRPCSRSTAIRPRSCGPGRRRSCSPRSNRSSSCSRRPARSTSASCSRSTRRAARSRPKTSSSEVLASVLRRAPRRRRRRLPLRLPPPRRRAAAAAHGRRARLRGARPRARRVARVGRRAPTAASPYSSTRVRELLARGRRRGRGRDPRPAARGARPGRARRRPRPRARLPDRERRACPSASACPPTACTRAPSSATTASSAPAAISLGRRPTFYAEAGLLLLEAYVLDFDGDLYGQPAQGAVPPPAAGPGALRRASTTSSPRWHRDVEAVRGRAPVEPGR